MNVSIVVNARAAKAMLGQYESRELHNRLRRGVRAGAAVYRAELRREARSRDDIPDSFAKTRTRSSSSMRSGIYTSVRPVSPLVSIFESGASGHEIAPGKLLVGGRALLMSGKAGVRWRPRDFVASMPVRHPGMKARPILAPSFAAATPAARQAAATVVFGPSSLGVLGFGPDD